MKTALTYFIASLVLMGICTLFADFGWRIPYVIGAAWLSMVAAVAGGAGLVVDAMYRLEELRINRGDLERRISELEDSNA